MTNKKSFGKLRVFAALAMAFGLCLPAFGGPPSGCADLDAFAPQPGVDFASQVQPILTDCSGCHGQGGAAGLDLRPGQAYANLVGVESTTNPPRARVQPFEPDESVLLSAVNCATPGGPAFQMPGTEPSQRALIRDWIAQGALPRPAPRAIPVLHPGGAAILMALVMLGLFFSAKRRGRRRA